MPPELFSDHFIGKMADSWSVGVLFFELLHGFLPFEGFSSLETQNKVAVERIEFSDQISKHSRSFISHLLRFDPKERLSISEAFLHPLILKYSHPLHDSLREPMGRTKTEPRDLLNFRQLSKELKKNTKTPWSLSERKNPFVDSRLRVPFENGLVAGEALRTIAEGNGNRNSKNQMECSIDWVEEDIKGLSKRDFKEESLKEDSKFCESQRNDSCSMNTPFLTTRKREEYRLHEKSQNCSPRSSRAAFDSLRGLKEQERQANPPGKSLYDLTSSLKGPLSRKDLEALQMKQKKPFIFTCELEKDRMDFNATQRSTGRNSSVKGAHLNFKGGSRGSSRESKTEGNFMGTLPTNERNSKGKHTNQEGRNPFEEVDWGLTLEDYHLKGKSPGPFLREKRVFLDPSHPYQGDPYNWRKYPFSFLFI